MIDSYFTVYQSRRPLVSGEAPAGLPEPDARGAPLERAERYRRLMEDLPAPRFRQAGMIRRSAITERSLRPIAQIDSPKEQLHTFQTLAITSD